MFKTVAIDIDLKPFKGMKVYSCCGKCGKSVRLNKPLFGSLHFCDKTKAKLEYEQESKSHFEQQYCLSDAEIRDMMMASNYRNQMQQVSSQGLRAMMQAQQQQQQQQ